MPLSSDPTKHPFEALGRYEVDHLPEHLAAAGLHEELHRLLSLETMSGTNAWFDLRNAAGSVEPFYDDVALARRCCTGESSVDREFGRQFRYDLIVASLRQSRGVPEVLFEALLREGLWTPTQALGFARHHGSDTERPVQIALAGVWMGEPEGQFVLQEAVEATRTVKLSSDAARLGDRGPEDPRLELLDRIAPFLSGASADAGAELYLQTSRNHLDDGFAVLISRTNTASRHRLVSYVVRAELALDVAGQALATLASHESSPFLVDSLNRLVEIALKEDDAVSGGLEAMYVAALPYLVGEVQHRTLGAVVDRLGSASDYLEKFPSSGRWIAEHVSCRVLFKKASRIDRPEERARLFGRLASFVSDRRTALSYARRAALQIKHPIVRAGQLEELALQAGESEQARILASARSAAEEEKEPSTMARIYARCAAASASERRAKFLRKAIVNVRSLPPSNRAEAIGEVARILPEATDQLFRVARDILDVQAKHSALVELAPRGDPAIVDAALVAVRRLENSKLRIKPLVALSQCVTGAARSDLLREAEAIAFEANDVEEIANTLTDLFPHLSSPKKAESWVRVYAKAVTMGTPTARRQLRGATPAAIRSKYVGVSRKAQIRVLRSCTGDSARELAKAMLPESPREQVGFRGRLRHLMAALSESDRSNVVSDILRLLRYRRFTVGRDLREATVALAPFLGDEFPEAMKIIGAAGSANDRARIFTGMCTILSGERRRAAKMAAIRAVREVRGHEKRVKRLCGLAAICTPRERIRLAREAIKAAEAIRKPRRKDDALLRILDEYPSAAGSLVVPKMMKRDPVRLAEEIPARLSGCCDQSAVGRMVARARKFATPIDRAARLSVLSELARPKLRRELLRESLAIAGSDNDGFDERSERTRWALAVRLAWVGFAHEALSLASSIRVDKIRATALAGISSFLPRPLMMEAVRRSVSAASEFTQFQSMTVRAVAKAILRLPRSVVRTEVSVLIGRMAARDREAFLEDLRACIPTLGEIGGTAAMDELFAAVEDCSRWWP